MQVICFISDRVGLQTICIDTANLYTVATELFAEFDVRTVKVENRSNTQGMLRGFPSGAAFLLRAHMALIADSAVAKFKGNETPRKNKYIIAHDGLCSLELRKIES